MHMVIRVLTYAKNQEQALEQAETILERLTDNQQPFDYYTMFRDEDSSPVSGKGRWGSGIPVAAKARSQKGKKLIEEGWKATVDEFTRHMTKIRRILSLYTDEEIMSECSNDPKIKDMDLTLARHDMYKAGSYEGSAIWLYDQDGSGIRDKEHLANVMGKWPHLDETHKAFEKLDLWVVPADVHY